MALTIDASLQAMHVRKLAVWLFPDIVAIASELIKVLCHLGKSVEVGRKQRSTLVDMVQMMQASIAYRNTVFRGGTTPDLVHDDERARCSFFEDLRSLEHFHHER